MNTNWSFSLETGKHNHFWSRWDIYGEPGSHKIFELTVNPYRLLWNTLILSLSLSDIPLYWRNDNKCPRVPTKWQFYPSLVLGYTFPDRGYTCQDFGYIWPPKSVPGVHFLRTYNKRLDRPVISDWSFEIQYSFLTLYEKLFNSKFKCILSPPLSCTHGLATLFSALKSLKFRLYCEYKLLL